MSYYYSLRGWLETSHEHFGRVRDELLTIRRDVAEDRQSALYMRGWCWIEDEVNWTHFIFYGADVQAAGLTLMEQVLDRLTGLQCSVYGHFHAQGEDMERNYAYRITNDSWSVENASPLVDWAIVDDA